jgi:phosphoglycerate kinase
MEKEISIMGRALVRPERPFVAVVGGKKVSDKIGVLNNLIQRADRLLVGGAMANTFLKAHGLEIGTSYFEAEALDTAARLVREAKGASKDLLLPRDAVVTAELRPGVEYRVVPVTAVPAEQLIADIGPETVQTFAGALEGARTVVWNGPMGVFEIPPFDQGTRRIAEALTRVRGTTIVGGGDSVAALEEAGLADKVTHVSTGGGASLEFLEGKVLPGVAALDDA